MKYFSRIIFVGGVFLGVQGHALAQKTEVVCQDQMISESDRKSLNAGAQEVLDFVEPVVFDHKVGKCKRASLKLVRLCTLGKDGENETFESARIDFFADVGFPIGSGLRTSFIYDRNGGERSAFGIISDFEIENGGLDLRLISEQYIASIGVYREIAAHFYKATEGKARQLLLVQHQGRKVDGQVTGVEIVADCRF